MARYIDANLLKAEFTGNFTKAYAVSLIKSIIDQQPTADVQEVKHAKDLMATEPYGRGSFECSNCHFYDDDTYTIDTEIGRIKYCPNCGAKIDLEDDK